MDNPHTKPVEFWEWLIGDVAVDYPETIWLAEAFTRPAMMHGLGKVGFQQSYTYYAWRNEKWDLESYCQELARDSAHYMRPSFWPTTHDILTPYMTNGGPAAWKVRAALAATLVPTYGIYAGYELMESEPRPGAQEQIDNEKYEFKNRHWEDYEQYGSKAGPVDRLVAGADQPDPPRAPVPALDPEPAVPQRREFQRDGVLQAPDAARRAGRHDHRGGQSGPAPQPVDLVPPEHARARDALGRHVPGA